MKLSPAKEFWNREVRDFSPEEAAKFKEIPGCRWDYKKRCWIVPEDVLSLLGHEVHSPLGYLDAAVVYSPKGTKPYQNEFIVQAYMKHRYIAAFDTGLGKSRAAVEALRVWAKRILVVTPAIVRRNWLREFDKWWPDHPTISVIEKGKGRKNVSKPESERISAAYAAPIQVISYALLHHVEGSTYDAIIFDEAHNLKSCKSRQGKSALALVNSNPQAAVFPLSATVIPNQPTDLFGLLHVTWPGRFGKLNKNLSGSYEFNKRYSIPHVNEYGTVWKGLNAEHADELRFRLNYVMTRATKQEWAHLLPAFDVDTIWLPPMARTYDQIVSSLPENLSGDEFHKALLEATASPKVDAAVEWVKEAQEEATHIVLATHLRSTAYELGEKLGCPVITGALDPGQRDVLLESLKSSERAILVCTMHSLGIGIDLTQFTRVLMVELYWRPMTILQFMGRFPRLNSRSDIVFRMLVTEGSKDEEIALTVQRKIEDINKLVSAGLGEAKLEEAFKMSDEDILAGMEGLFDD